MIVAKYRVTLGKENDPKEIQIPPIEIEFPDAGEEHLQDILNTFLKNKEVRSDLKANQWLAGPLVVTKVEKVVKGD
jgi:hypothetical protein